MSNNPDQADGILLNNLKMLEDAAKYVGKPPFYIDRDSYIEAGEAAVRNFRMRGMEAQQATHIPPPYAPCILPLAKLDPMVISDLRLETHHHGRSLFLRTLTLPWRGCVSGGIKVIAEDMTGEGTILELYAVEREERRKAAEILPKGSFLVVKDPYMYMPDASQMREVSGIRVDHVSDVLFLDKHDSRIPAEWAKVVGIVDAKKLKMQGDLAIKKKMYHEAVSL